MNCKGIRPLLSAYLDEALPARQAGRVAGHLARCGACRTELKTLERACLALDRVTASAPPADLWERLVQRMDTEPARERTRPNLVIARPAPVWLVPSAALLAGLAAFALGISTNRADEAVLARAMAPARTNDERQTTNDRSGVRSSKFEARSEGEGALTSPLTSHFALRTSHFPSLTADLPVPPDALPSREGDVTAPARAVSPETDRKPRPLARPEAVAKAWRVGPQRSATLAEALQMSVETTTQERVVDEVALLAEALSQTAGGSNDLALPGLPGDSS